MASGIIYIMTTAVDGLIKIGKTDNFEKRMGELERNVNIWFITSDINLTY